MSTESEKVLFYGSRILFSDGMEYEKSLTHHGSSTCYEHSVNVALKSLELASRLSVPVDEKSLVVGALLHDYFLYDCHESAKLCRKHGFIHAEIALENACRDFNLNEIEKDIICKHMFPLNIHKPKYLESWIVCIADKICASKECAHTYRLRLMKLRYSQI